MINDNLLENRLNAVKQGKSIPTSPKQKNNSPMQQKPQQANPTVKQFFISESYKLFQVLTTSVLYGVGIDAIFATDWSILQMLGVGLIANHIVFNLLSLISKPLKK